MCVSFCSVTTLVCLSHTTLKGWAGDSRLSCRAVKWVLIIDYWSWQGFATSRRSLKHKLRLRWGETYPKEQNGLQHLCWTGWPPRSPQEQPTWYPHKQIPHPILLTCMPWSATSVCWYLGTFNCWCSSSTPFLFCPYLVLLPSPPLLWCHWYSKLVLNTFYFPFVRTHLSPHSTCLSSGSTHLWTSCVDLSWHCTGLLHWSCNYVSSCSFWS